MTANPDVTRWYDEKTEWLLDKYGPGPRIHFHTGIVDEDERPASGAADLRAQLRSAQERMLDRIADVWQAPKRMAGKAVMDVGCGLGGSALYFADRFGCRVRAVTPVPRHADIVNDLAETAGLGDSVCPEIGDAHSISGSAAGAYAIGASNYFDRPRWFRQMAAVVAPGGFVGVEDSFAADPELVEPFNSYWLSSVGTRDSYEVAAAEAGFALVAADDVTAAAGRYYRMNIAHSQALLAEDAVSDVAKRQRSIAWQTRFAAAYETRGFEDWILLFVRVR